jgi:dihydroorotase
LLEGGTVLDPSAGLSARLDVGIRGGKIAAVGADLSSTKSRRVVDVGGCYVTPGLIDLHTHMYWGVNEFGMEADPTCLRTGVTTAVDAGSAGAVNFGGLRRYVIEPSRTRILAFVHIALHGVQKAPATELRDVTYADVERAAQTLRENADVALGIKVRMSRWIVGENGVEALRRAQRATELGGGRLMVHIGGSPIPLEEILDCLRPGDIVTHFFTGNAPSVVDESGRVRDAVWRARERGVVFDVGHGKGSCSFPVVRASLAQGLKPDVISTDLHAFSVQGPVFDLPTTLSKFLALGMTLEEVVVASTTAPARAIGWQDRLGLIKVGREADLAVLALRDGPVTFHDADGNALDADRRLEARWTIRAGEPFASA